MKQTIKLILVTLLIYGCSSTHKIVKPEDLAALKMAVENSVFEIVSNSANPVAFTNTRGLENLLPPGSNLGSINLVNNPNFFKVQNDSIKLYLPYYGEQQIVTAYSSESGLQFEGKAKSSKKNFNAKRNEYNITYSLKADKESLTINLTLFPNNNATLRVNSSIRTPIIYYGSWK